MSPEVIRQDGCVPVTVSDVITYSPYSEKLTIREASFTMHRVW